MASLYCEASICVKLSRIFKVTIENNQALSLTGDDAIEEVGFLGGGFNFENAEATEWKSPNPSNTVAEVNLETMSNATYALQWIDAGIEHINKIRANIGAASSQISASLNGTRSAIFHAEGSKGEIIDLNYAKEATTYAVSSMVQETSTALLAQANAPKDAVQILLTNVMGYTTSLAFMGAPPT